MCALILCGVTAAAQVPVRHKEGLVHGFLTLRTLEGELIADGDLIQNTHGDRVTSRLVFHFKDGSLHDETAVFSQRGHFRLLSDHLIQKGPSFERPMDVTIDCSKGRVIIRYSEDGQEKIADDQIPLPADLANGVIMTLLKNIPPDAAETKVSYVALTPKPRVVNLVIKPQGEEAFSTGGEHRKAMHFALHVDIGGLTGALAKLLGKQPPDTEVWILEGEAPTFVKSEGPLALDGPSWRIEPVSPAWPAARPQP